MHQNLEWSGESCREWIDILILPRYKAVHQQREIVGCIKEMDLRVMTMIGTFGMIGKHKHHPLREDTEDDKWGWRDEMLKWQREYS